MRNVIFKVFSIYLPVASHHPHISENPIVVFSETNVILSSYQWLNGDESRNMAFLKNQPQILSTTNSFTV